MLNSKGGPDAVTMRLIGSRLRELRLTRGLSLREAGRRSGLSHSFINIVEGGTSNISFTRLIRLANTYGVLINELLVDVMGQGVEFVAAGEGLVFPVAAAGVELKYLSGPGWKIQSFIVRLEPGSRLERFSQAPEKFIYCIEGTPGVMVDDVLFPLNVGDTMHIPSYSDHCYVNESDQIAAFVGATERMSYTALRDESVTISDREPL